MGVLLCEALINPFFLREEGVTKDGWIREADGIKMKRRWKQKVLPPPEWPSRYGLLYWLARTEFAAEGVLMDVVTK